MFKFIDNFLDGWTKIDDLPTWIDKRRLHNKGIIRGKNFLYRYDNHLIRHDHKWVGYEEQGHGIHYLTSGDPTYHRKKIEVKNACH